MISLYHSTDDPFGLYGIHRFIEKSGIPVEINKPTSSGVVITYGEKVKADFVITVEQNEIKKSICGKIILKSGTIPVSELPKDTGSGEEVLAYFENNTSRYPCITKTNQGIIIGIDIFKESGCLLAGHLDTIRPSLDLLIKKEIASKPVVDLLENLLFNAILAGCNKKNIPLVQKSYWPNGKKFAVCLTHDVDEIKKTYQWISRPLRFLLKMDLQGFIGQSQSFIQKIKGIEPYFTYEDIISIEDNFGAKSTYFFLKESGNPRIFSIKTWYLYGRNRSFQSPDIKTLIQRLLANGDEVAIHGSYFSYLQPKLLEEETRELEGIICGKIVGSRQHNLNLEIPETWDHQISAGLMYDTTLGFKDTIGFRWGTSFPFFPNTGKEHVPLLEIPLIIMDVCLESSTNKISDCLNIADHVANHHGVLTLLWHPPIINTLEYPCARDIYIQINQYCREKGAWITRAKDIFEWITLRNQQKFSVSCNGSLCSIFFYGTDPQCHFTLNLPPGTNCHVMSGNADIIRKDGNCVYLKTHHQQMHNEIIVGIE